MLPILTNSLCTRCVQCVTPIINLPNNHTRTAVVLVKQKPSIRESLCLRHPERNILVSVVHK